MVASPIGRSVTLLAAIVACAAVSGCGSDDGSDKDAAADRAAVRSVYGKMRTALQKGDGTTACSLMVVRTQREFAKLGEAVGGTCEAGFATLLERVDERPPTPTLVAIEVDGDKAVVTARTPTSKRPQRAPFIRERGTWRVSNWFRD